MLVPETKEAEFLDVDFGEDTQGDWDTVPTGWYTCVIEDLNLSKKSDNKRNSDLALKRKENPNATLEQVDEYQWVWSLRIADGEYADQSIVVKTSRSFHEKSNAGKMAAAALGMTKWDRAAARQMAEAAGVSGTALLMGKRVYASVTEDPDSQGRNWNNVKEYRVPPAPRQRKAQTGGRVQLPDYPTDQDDDLWPADEK